MDQDNNNKLIYAVLGSALVSGGGTHLVNNVSLSEEVNNCAPLVERKQELMELDCAIKLIRCEIGR